MHDGPERPPIADRGRVPGQTMGRTPARLEAHEHLVRERSQSDRRNQLLRISEEGVPALKQGVAVDRLAVMIRALGNYGFSRPALS